jgi:dynein heavy chain
LIRGELQSVQRKILVSLITTDVHNRDIVDYLFDEGVVAVSDFAW